MRIRLRFRRACWPRLTAFERVAQSAGEFPDRHVSSIVVPFAAGGPTDVVARILAEQLSARWGGKSVIIENRPGAGTIVATAAVAKARARRPHGADRHQLAADQSGDRHEAALRHLQGTGRRQHDRDPAGRAGRQQGISRQHASRSWSRRPRTRRQAQLHLARPARRRASRRRDAQAARRHRDDAHQLQRQRAGADRHDRRAACR